MKSFYFIVLICAIAALAGVLFGFDTGVISGALLFIQKDFPLTSVTTGAVVSAVLLGAFLGSLFCGRITDSIGRKTTIIGTAVLFVVGSLASALASSVWHLILSRFVLGLSIGISSFAAPLYISESAPSKHRGKLVALFQLAITFGILQAYIVNLAFTETGAWRWMVGFGVFPAGLFLMAICFVPKSPRWLMLKHREQEARKILQQIRSFNHNVDEEVDLIKKSIAQHKKNSWKELFKRWVVPVNFIGFGLAFFQQVTGINTIIYYAPTIFKTAGFHDAGSVLATVGIGVVNLIATACAIPFLDKLGRRPFLLIGLTGMAIGQFMLTYVFSHGANTEFLQILSIVSILLFIASFAISLGIIMWLMFSEIFPLEIRGFAMSIATATNWFFNMLISFSFLPLTELFGETVIFFSFGLLCVLGWFFVFFFVPETKQVSLEEIERNLKKGVSCVNLGQKIR